MPTSTNTTMPKKTSALWDYFEEDKDDFTFVICKVGDCEKKISRGKSGTERNRLSNTGLRTHLSSHHKKEWNEFLAKDQKQEETKDAEAAKMTEEDETENMGVPLFQLRTHKKRKSFFHQNLPDMVEARLTYEAEDPRAKVKHQGILTMMVTDLQPFSMVNDPGFLNFSRLMDPRFTVGSAMYYRRLLDKAFIKGKDKVQKKLKEAEPSSVSIQLDGWSQHHHGFIGLLVNYITKGRRRTKICLACSQYDSSHTGENMARWVESECDKWGITEEVGVVTTDTASNMLKMMDYLPIHFLHGGCLNHIIQLVIKDELLEKASIKNLIKACRHICTYSNQSVQLSQFILAKQIEAGKDKSQCLNLVQDVVTRWNSTFLMLQRFIILQPVIRDVLLDQQWQRKLDTRITNADWSLMEKVVMVLKVFYEATVRLSSNSACISDVIPTITGLIVSLSSEDRDDLGVRDFKRKLNTSLNERLGAKEEFEK